MKVFNLEGQEGNYETDPAGHPPGTRSFGFWSYNTPAVGDLVHLFSRRVNGKVLYQIKSVGLNFTGSNGDHFWKGVMVDVVYNNILTDEMLAELSKSGASKAS